MKPPLDKDKVTEAPINDKQNDPSNESELEKVNLEIQIMRWEIKVLITGLFISTAQVLLSLAQLMKR